jgi:hypothetical protein
MKGQRLLLRRHGNGSASGFAVCSVGALDPSMNLTVGCSGPITPVADAGAGGASGTAAKAPAADPAQAERLVQAAYLGRAG